MANNIKNQETEIKIDEALSKTDKFIAKYKYHAIGVLSAVVICVLGSYIYKSFILEPQKQEAMGQTFVAEQYFRDGDFDKALNGDGNALGFAQLIQEYGNKCGEAIYYYAGVSALKLGNYQDAIDFLKKYKGEELLVSAKALACMGDAYASLSNLKGALDCYKKAASKANNIFSANYLLKAGIIYEEMGDKENALKMYEEIKTKYPQSTEGYEVNKYISRIQVSK